jgi:hypothetical protein
MPEISLRWLALFRSPLATRREPIRQPLDCAIVDGRLVSNSSRCARRASSWASSFPPRTFQHPTRFEDVQGGRGCVFDDVVETWDSTTLVSGLKLQVSKDLQYTPSTAPWSAAWSAS